MSTKTGLFILTACAPLYATTLQESFLKSLYAPGEYSTTIEFAKKLPGITQNDLDGLGLSWMCLPTGKKWQRGKNIELQYSHAVLDILPVSLIKNYGNLVDDIASAGNFLAAKLQGYGDNPVETTASLAALKEGINTEPDPIKKAALERAHVFVQLIRDIDTALKTHIDAQEIDQVNRAVDNVVQNIIKLTGGDTNLNLYLNFKDASTLKAHVKSKITGTKANKPAARVKKARNSR